MRRRETKKCVTEGSVATEELTVDFPQEGDCITGPDYTLRIGTTAASHVEVSIDANEWQPCRQADGYWWFDWSGYLPGKHQAVARIRPQNNGQEPMSGLRRFRVKLA